MRNVKVYLAAALCLLALVGAAAAGAQIMGLFYQEVEKDGRIYVFNTPEQLKAWSESGDMGKAVTLVGRAVGGKTLVAENETAVDLYLFKHDLPGYDRPTPVPAKPPKYPATKIQGRLYADFTSKEIKNDDGSKSSDSGIGIDVKRFYFTVTHQVDETWSAQFQSDIGDFGAKRYDVFVKKAFLQGKFSDALTVRLGSADMAWIPFEEKMWGRRYFEQTQPDSLGFGTSADWGVHVLGKLAGGLVDYQVSAVNGRGYSNPSRSESVDFEGRISVEPIQGLTFAVGGYSGKLGQARKSNDPTKHTAQRLNGLVNWTGARFGVGASYYQTENWKNVTTEATDSSDGFSIWADFAATKSLNVFARYDEGNPSKDLKPNDDITYYAVGLEKVFNKVFTGTLAYKHADTNGKVSTGNGAIGGTLDGQYDEVGVWVVYNF